jgi:ABC-type transporter MlaC component
MAVIQSSNERVLEIYSAAEVVDEETQAAVFAVMEEVTSFTALADAAIDSFCDDMDAAKCQEFKDVFVELLQASAATRAGRYRADRFEYLTQEVEDDSALVRTLAFYEEDSVEIDYHLEPVDGRWMIVNYAVEGVDTIRNYRKQFTKLLRQESVDDVIDRMRRQIAEF